MPPAKKTERKAAKEQPEKQPEEQPEEQEPEPEPERKAAGDLSPSAIARLPRRENVELEEQPPTFLVREQVGGEDEERLVTPGHVDPIPLRPSKRDTYEKDQATRAEQD